MELEQSLAMIAAFNLTKLVWIAIAIVIGIQMIPVVLNHFSAEHQDREDRKSR